MGIIRFLIQRRFQPSVKHIRTASLLMVLALAGVCAGLLGPSRVGATNHSVIIDEMMAGANGNSDIQFVEMRMNGSSQNAWGPQTGESVGRARLVFFDSSGTQTGQFVFDSNPPGSSNGSALIATQAFADLSTTPTPDFIIDPLISTGSGKVCFKDNPSNPFRFSINLCLSYGDFPSGSTEGAGDPAAELPLNGASSLKRVSNLTSFGGQSNADFELSDAAPKNGSGATGTVPLSATQLAFTVQPSNTVADASISPAVQVEVQDALGDKHTTATNSITLAIGTDPSGTATLSGTKTVSAVDGVATFSDLSIDNAGTGFTLAASASGLTGATSGTFDINAGAAAKLGFTVEPSNTTSGTSITAAVKVAVQDSAGNTVTSATDSVTVAIGTDPSGTATLSGTKTVNAVDGVATFSNLSIDNAGTGFTLAASASGLTGATSGTFDIINCSPPASDEDWTVVLSCTLQGNATARRNVIVQAGIALTIDTGVALDIDFSNFHLLIKNNAMVVIKSGGKIF